MINTTTLKYPTRWMIRHDLPAVLAIEAGSSNPPWDRQEFLGTLRHRSVIGQVAELPDESVGGFVVYELRSRSIRVLKLAVHPGLRRQGVGTALATKLASKLADHRRIALVADVPAGQVGGQLFLQSMGWRATAICHSGEPDEAYRMIYHLQPTVEPTDRGGNLKPWEGW
jgi:[ribosomal protein S18]-alanine N-acetyltransferase